jgi:hypothetical protein
MTNETSDDIIKFFRLSNNDDVIADVRDLGDGNYTMENAMRVVVDADLDAGRQTIYMHNWMPQGVVLGNKCKINSKDILFSGEVEPDILDYYRGVVFEMLEDRGPFKRVDDEKKKKKENEGTSTKIITFPTNKNKE